MQVFPWQQPEQFEGPHVGFVVWHWPATQIWPLEQATHAFPPVPHALAFGEVMQVFP